MRLSGLCIGILILCVTHVYSSGIAIHLAIATRLTPFLPHDIASRDLIGALLAGSFHPDCFYNCLGLHRTSEEAHWPPFLSYGVQFYNRKYGVLEKNDPSQDPEQHLKDGKRLKAFLYGVFLHQISDISWHSLYLKQGLLPMLTQMEFDGATGSAHSFLDTASDFLMISKLLKNSNIELQDEILEYLGTEWDIPSDDLVEIYNFMGYETMNRNKLEFCMFTGYSALKAELSSGKGISSYYVTESPLMDDILDDYYLGGLNEMEATSQICIGNFNRWFETGNVNQNPWELCSIYHEHDLKLSSTNRKMDTSVRQTTNVTLSSNSQNSLFITSYITNSRFGTSILPTYIGKDLYLAVGAETEEVSGSVYMISVKDVLGDSNAEQLISSKLKTNVGEIGDYSSVMYPDRFGNKIAEWRLTSKSDSLSITVINKPGKSELMLYLEGNLIAILRSPASVYKLGGSGTKELGLSFHVDDINGDGYNDLIIGSYFCDGKNDYQQGQVIVLSGSRLLSSLVSNQVNNDPEQQPMYHTRDTVSVIQLEELKIMEYTLPSIYQFHSQYEQFGKTISTTDNLIFVSINALGSVLVFDKFTGEFLYRINHLGVIISAEEDEREKPSRLKSKETGLFGYNFILSGKLQDSREYILISAKSKTYDSCVMCGSIFMFIVQRKKVDLVNEIVCEPKLSYENHMINLGESAIRDGDMVYISSTNFEGKGAIFKINVEILLMKADITKSKITYLRGEDVLFMGNSNEGFTRFGHDIQLLEYSGDKYMAIGMPYFGYNLIYSDLKLFGKIGIYKLDN